jgi:hypothetical protein
MSNSSFQPSLSNLPSFGIEKRKKHMWKMDQKTLDQKTLEQRRIRILDFRRLFLLQLNKVIPNMWRE